MDVFTSVLRSRVADAAHAAAAVRQAGEQDEIDQHTARLADLVDIADRNSVPVADLLDPADTEPDAK